MYSILNTNKQIIAKDFKSKPEALAYAKFYLKTKVIIKKQ